MLVHGTTHYGTPFAVDIVYSKEYEVFLLLRALCITQQHYTYMTMLRSIPAENCRVTVLYTL